MNGVFWIGLGIAGFSILTGLWAGARSAETSASTGALIGAAFGLMLGFPLLAIGIATA